MMKCYIKKLKKKILKIYLMVRFLEKIMFMFLKHLIILFIQEYSLKKKLSKT